MIRRLPPTNGSVGHLALIGSPIKVGSLQLEADDLLFVYTDGANEMLALAAAAGL